RCQSLRQDKRFSGGSRPIPGSFVAFLYAPWSAGVDGKAGGVMVDANTDPAGVAGDVIDAIRHGTAQFGDLEVVHTHRLGIAFATQLATGVLEVADQLFLFGVHRNRRFTRGQSGADLCIDVAERSSRSGLSLPSRVLRLPCRL